MRTTIISGGRILAFSSIAVLLIIVGLLEILSTTPARAQDQYSDQYQYDTNNSSTAPDYTPDPPVGCYYYTDDPSEGDICLNGTEPSRNGHWNDYLTNSPESTGEPVYTEDIYSLGLSNVPNQANKYIWRPWFYIPSIGWNPGD